MSSEFALHDESPHDFHGSRADSVGFQPPGKPWAEAWMQAGVVRVERALARLLPAEEGAETDLVPAMRYATLSGGKRTRALLCLAAGALSDTPPARLDDIGAAIEMMHACTLVHDDLPAMDDDVLRRGLPTVHVKFGEATAILVGDALQAQAFLTLAHLDAPGDVRVALMRELAQAVSTEGAAGGQALDLALVGKHASVDQVLAMHRLKSGALVRASVRLGALGALPDKPRHAELYAALDGFGAAFGLALQVVDDIIDVTLDTATLGKTAGKDAAASKPTCVSTLGLPAARQLALELFRDARLALAPLGSRARRLEQMLEQAERYLH
ncbi:farnesyl-diphosphate synthase [Pseudomonas oryzihabitans]|nr:farnesyl-diphosphate synthase [Pseudomonas psychrotolerans]KTT40006.1 farnesyl-diphosphate synthase [Pseudomonas psychrotolerans]KTT43814.1 farnesyl-diphosphate synthase [Pseudomonas psychrotolerans]KTT64550.1 farnesyl-diphosphate synthase [Pseudomonas psychrotolerans]